MKKEWIGTALIPAVLAVSAALVAVATAGAPSKVRVRANFDNAYVHVSQPGERHLEIEVIAPDGGSYVVERRPPLNVALVIDKSGSMAQAGKMDYVKRAARETVDRLRYGDRFSVVSYDDAVRVLIPSEALEDRHGAKRAIDRLYPGGSTNLGAGLVEASSRFAVTMIPRGSTVSFFSPTAWPTGVSPLPGSSPGSSTAKAATAFPSPLSASGRTSTKTCSPPWPRAAGEPTTT